MKKILLLLSLFSCIQNIYSEQSDPEKGKKHTARISRPPDAGYIKAILWQINGSSILAANSPEASVITGYMSNMTEMLRIREGMNMMQGAFRGFRLALNSGIMSVNSIPGGPGLLTVPVSSPEGFYTGGLAARAGALAGAVKNARAIKLET
ncbi:MAG TPA: hypothetical protein PLX08_04430 [Bacteroidales bacterium]|jgi:hypothetical protein|nr:hypothetical protein [Bacteroidales bacterium]